jgi:hypothetical protein
LYCVGTRSRICKEQELIELGMLKRKKSGQPGDNVFASNSVAFMADRKKQQAKLA